MKSYQIEEKEIFSFLTARQIREICDVGISKDFDEDEIIYEQKEKAQNLFILLEGEISLKIPSSENMPIEYYSLEIERIRDHGTVFGPNRLFGIQRYFTRARAIRASKIMIINTDIFLDIIRKNKNEFQIS